MLLYWNLSRAIKSKREVVVIVGLLVGLHTWVFQPYSGMWEWNSTLAKTQLPHYKYGNSTEYSMKFNCVQLFENGISFLL